MKKIRKILGNTLLLSLLSSTFMFTAQATNRGAVNISGISSHGQKAIEQISTCINSEDKNSLNVLYLIDESASLQATDPDSLRVNGIRASLEQFRNVTNERPYFQINRSISTFADKYNIRKNWTKLDQNQLNSDLNWISNEVPNLNNGQSTNWLLALNNAYKQFEQVMSTSSCNVMVWFTDGAIDLGPRDITAQAVQQICGVNPVNLNSTSVALIDKFRSNGINIQGVLLKNQDLFENPEKYDSTAKIVEDARNGMSYFLPILEAQGNVGTQYFGGSANKTLNCGEDVGALGVQQTIGDPMDIIWFPVPFNCLATNGRILPISNEKVSIDPGMTRFEVTTPRNGLTLKNGSGVLLASASGIGKGDISMNPLGKSDSIVMIQGDISSNGAVAPGNWTFKNSQPDRAVFCGHLDVQIEIKGKTCYENESCEFNGRILQNGKPVDFSLFSGSPELSYAPLKSNGTEASQNSLSLNSTNGSYTGSFGTNGLVDTNGIARLKVKINLTTKSGYEFSISSIKDFAVVPPGLYPEVDPNPVLKADFSQGLQGKQGKALAKITLSGPSRSNGEICFSNLQIRTDVLPSRIPEYVSAINGEELSKNPCFALKAGEKSIVTLDIKNGKSATGTSAGFINTVLKSEGKPDIKSKVDIEFETSEVHNPMLFWLIFISTMLIGFGLPLGLFYLVNALGAKIQLSNLSMANVPVVLTASGGFVNLARKEPGKSSGVLTYDDFNGFKHTDEKVKEVQINSEILRGKAPKNPFGAIKAIITTSPGHVVTTSELNTHGEKGLDRNQAVASLNPSGMFYLTLSESSLASLKKQNSGIEENMDQVEADLISIIGFRSMDPNQDIEALNMKLGTQSGWLDRLLKISEPAPIVEKPAKRGKKSKEIPATPAVSTSNDDWGMTSSNVASVDKSPESKKIKPTPNADDWGTSSSGGGTDWGSTSSGDDWGNPSSGSKGNDGW